MRLIRFIKHLLWLYRREKQWAHDLRPIMSVECVDASYDYCLIIAGRNPHIPREQKGVVATVLWTRAGRGKVSIEDAIARYGYHHLDKGVA